MKNKFKKNEHVIIKKYIGDKMNERGVISTINHNDYWVANINMPYYGTICGWFNEKELEKIK